MKKTSYSLRTQISLSPQLRKLIDQQRAYSQESLSDYLRKAAILRMVAEEVEKKNLEQIAQAVIGKVSKSKSGWRKTKDITVWQRKKRAHEDKHRS